MSVRGEGKRVWRGRCASDPAASVALIRKHTPSPERVVFKTGPLSVWFFHALKTEGSPAICIDECDAKAALDMAGNKNDANDDDGLAHLAEVGFYKEVRVKSFDSMLARTPVAARTRLVRIETELFNQISGLIKTFGFDVPPATGSKFERQVGALLADNVGLGRLIRPLPEAWHAARLRAVELARKLLADAQRNDACRLLKAIPGVGVVTAASFIAPINDPTNFKNSRSVGAWVGLTTRRYQKGGIENDGFISRRGNSQLRGLLYEAATVLLVRGRSECDLRKLGLRRRERLGFERAAVAAARKLAVIMHTMLITASRSSRHPLEPDTRARPRRKAVRDVLPRRRPTDSATLVSLSASGRAKCVPNLGEVAPPSPIIRRHMPTAKTTMLPATASHKGLAPDAIRR